MTKAERIFTRTMVDIKESIRIDEEMGFNHITISRLVYGEEELIYKRTINDLKQIYNSALKRLKIDYTTGIITKEEALFEKEALGIMYKTILKAEETAF